MTTAQVHATFLANPLGAILDRLVMPPNETLPLSVFRPWKPTQLSTLYATANWMADFDLTGIAWDNSQSTGQRKITAITPRHLLGAEHVVLNVADTVRFLDSSNAWHTRTIAGKQRVGLTDIMVFYLGADLPAGCATYKLLPSDANDYLNIPDDDDSDDQTRFPVCINGWRGYGLQAPETNTNRHLFGCAAASLVAPTVLKQQPFDAHGDYWFQWTTGDSGNPIFVPFDLDAGPELVLLGHASGGSVTYGNGIIYPPYTRQIIEACAALDTDETGHEPELFDLEGLAAEWQVSFRCPAGAGV